MFVVQKSAVLWVPVSVQRWAPLARSRLRAPSDVACGSPLSVLHVTCGVCASLCGRLWVGMVERDVCEVRPCDPCARVCPVCVPAPPGVFLPV